MQRRPMAMGAFRSGARRAMAAMTLGLAVACGGGGAQVAPEDTDTWRTRGLWIEKHGDTSLVMVVGRAENASMGETFVLSSAEQTRASRLTIQLA
jgi:hypothetical protein